MLIIRGGCRVEGDNHTEVSQQHSTSTLQISMISGKNKKWSVLSDVVVFFLQVYEQELEKVDVFEKFQDMVKTFELHRGKAKPGEDATVVGEFKVLKSKLKGVGVLI